MVQQGVGTLINIAMYRIRTRSFRGGLPLKKSRRKAPRRVPLKVRVRPDASPLRRANDPQWECGNKSGVVVVGVGGVSYARFKARNDDRNWSNLGMQIKGTAARDKTYRVTRNRLLSYYYYDTEMYCYARLMVLVTCCTTTKHPNKAETV